MTSSNFKIPNEHNQLPHGEENIDIIQIFYKILSKWYWIALSIFLFVAAAFIYLRYSTPIYNTTAKLLVVDEKRGGGMMEMSMLGDLSSMMGVKSNVDNEIEVLKTYDLMREVVDELNSQVIYSIKGRVKETETLNTPYFMEIITQEDSITKDFRFELLVEEGERLKIVSKNFEVETSEGAMVILPNQIYVRFHKNPHYLEDFSINSSKNIIIDLKPVSWITEKYIQNLSVSSTNKQTSTIDLSFNYPLPEKGKLIIQTLIDKYVARTLKDKNTIADSTLSFIDERLRYVGQELGLAEDRIQSFKQESQLADISEQSKILLENASEYAKDLAAVESQILMLDEVNRYLADPNQLRVVPTSISENDLTFSSLVQNYNKLLLDRERLLLSHTPENPIIRNLDQQIQTLREDMRSYIQSAKRQLQVTRNSLASKNRQFEAEIRRVPATERGFVDLARQQQIKQELYLFLQEKWEETAISKTANISNSKVIDSPRINAIPVSPKKGIILLAAFIMGLMIPLGIFYLQDLLNIRIRTKEDITKATSIPIVGEIGKHSLGEENQVVVTKESRDPLSEQFRALRTNLEFFRKSTGSRTIVLTSSMSGEGKSFISVNLAVAMALLGKKVVVLEFDLRKPSLSAKMGHSNGFGYTNYILQEDLTVMDVVKNSLIYDNLDLISSGPLPPNPAELLLSNRTKAMMIELKEQYDYIIVDAPPIGLVTDAQLIGAYADQALYIVRQDFTYKKQLEIVNDLLYTEKLPSLSIIVNDVKAGTGYGGYGSYGGYGYGDYYRNSNHRWWWPFGKNK